MGTGGAMETKEAQGRNINSSTRNSSGKITKITIQTSEEINRWKI